MLNLRKTWIVLSSVQVWTEPVLHMFLSYSFCLHSDCIIQCLLTVYKSGKKRKIERKVLSFGNGQVRYVKECKRKLNSPNICDTVVTKTYPLGDSHYYEYNELHYNPYVTAHYFLGSDDMLSCCCHVVSERERPLESSFSAQSLLWMDSNEQWQLCNVSTHHCSSNFPIISRCEIGYSFCLVCLNKTLVYSNPPFFLLYCA